MAKGAITFYLIKERLFFFVLAVFLFFAWRPAAGQSFNGLSTINVDNLTNDEVTQLMSKGASMGYSPDEMIQFVMAQGMSADQASKLTERVSGLASRVAIGKSYPGDQSKKQGDGQNIRLPVSPKAREPEQKLPLEKRLFGFSLFSDESLKLSFEPGLQLPTPASYILGPGDALFIDVYGAAEQYIEALINAEGSIIIPHFGHIPLSGLTIEQATSRIKSKLSTAYTGLKGAVPNTFINVSLAVVRTMRISMVGELRVPGTYTLSSLASVFNALYVAGGITTNGTFRNIKVYRNNSLLTTVDAYEFLIHGKAENNIRLQDQDVILVEPYQSRVEVTGEVKRPGVFELAGKETFKDVLAYAGGFTDQSYRDRISVSRQTNNEKMVADIFQDQFELFTPKSGDAYTVGKILDRYSNRVQIKGAVFREGVYSLTGGLTVGNLIKRADGLTGDAYTTRATITRTMDNLATETISFDLMSLLNGGVADILLQKEDVVTIFSRYDLKEEYYVTITGEVNQGGEFSYSTNLTVEDLIALASGLREAASESNIEITRRVKDLNSRDISDIILISVNKDLTIEGEAGGTKLEPFDHVVVRRNPNYRVERFVQVDGEVLYPGRYAIRNVNERISDIIKRAGGLTEFGYSRGATLIRRTEFFNEEPELLRQIQSLQGVKESLSSAATDPTEAESILSEKVDEEVGQKASDLSGNRYLSSYAKKERLKEIGQLNPLAASGLKETEIIGINLGEILSGPGSKYDLILEEGDVISVPKQLQTVRLRGRVLYPTTVRHESGKSARHFIGKAGGFDSRARRGRTYVVHANGEVLRTKSFLFMRNYPDVEPGSEVIVPVKPIKLPWKPGEIIGITTGLATLAVLISQINFKQ